VIERATLSENVGFPLVAPVSSYIHYKSPNIVYRVNNVIVEAQLSIQYFKKMYFNTFKKIFITIAITRNLIEIRKRIRDYYFRKIDAVLM
jgi:hypothetical protein